MSVENLSFENEPETEKGGEKPKTDWSRVDAVCRKMNDEERAKMTPEERAEEDSRRKRVKNTLRYFDNQEKLKTGTPEEKKQAKKELDAEKEKRQKLVDKMNAERNEQLQIDLETIKRQTYDEINRRTEEHRRKYGIEVPAAELKREDQELRKRLGLK